MIDEKKLQQFLGKMIVDLGAAMSVPLVRIGMRLGLYKAMDGAGPMTSGEFATKANISERYAREWLAQNAASGYLTYEPAGRRFELPPEQAMVFANDASAFFMGGGFDAVAALHQTQPLIEGAFKSGGGVDWGDHAGCLFCAVGAMLRPRYSANIIQNWLPALDGVVAKLERGAEVADIGCGTGHSTFIMARAFPNSSFVGYDFHEPSIEHATDLARTSGGAGNARFEVAKAKASEILGNRVVDLAGQSLPLGQRTRPPLGGRQVVLGPQQIVQHSLPANRHSSVPTATAPVVDSTPQPLLVPSLSTFAAP